MRCSPASLEASGRPRIVSINDIPGVRGDVARVILSDTRSNTRRSGSAILADFAADQFAGIVVILDDVDVTAFLRVALDDRKFAMPEFLDGLGLAIKIVFMDSVDRLAKSLDNSLQKSWTRFGDVRGCSEGEYRINT